jgi:hypothetical protein
VVVGHETPWSRLTAVLPRPLGGTGTSLKVQLLPFHRSAAGVPWESPAGPPLPTARQYLADAQDTLYSAPLPGDLGTATSVHVLPFHDSARAAVLSLSRKASPTAMQLCCDLQATPNRAPPEVPAGSFSALADQVRPFQVSAIGPPSPPSAVSL